MAEPLRPLADFLPLVLPEAPGVFNPLAVQALRLSAAEYCTLTRCWRHAVSVTLTADGADPIVVPDHTSLFEIEAALWGDTREPLTPIAYTDVMDDWPLTQAGTFPEYVTQTSANTITVLPKVVGTLHLSAFIRPIAGPDDLIAPSGPTADPYSAVNQVPAFLFNDVAETIASGALARILRKPGQTYTNPDMAAFHMGLFQQGADRNKRASIRGKHRAVKRARPVWF